MRGIFVLERWLYALGLTLLLISLILTPRGTVYADGGGIGGSGGNEEVCSGLNCIGDCVLSGADACSGACDTSSNGCKACKTCYFEDQGSSGAGRCNCKK